MSPKPRPTFNKLQKERARQQKQREKNERKQQRKLEKVAGQPSVDDAQDIDRDIAKSQHELPDTPETRDLNDMS